MMQILNWLWEKFVKQQVIGNRQNAGMKKLWLMAMLMLNVF